MKYALKLILFISIVFGVSLPTFAACANTGSWYNPSWLYRKTVCIDHTLVPGNLTAFTVYVTRATDSDLSARAQADGDDILFTSSDGTTKINYEREFYASGTLRAWVITDLSSTVDTLLYLYYGNAGASDQQLAASAWDANYKCIQHFGDGTTLALTDPLGNCTGTNHSATAIVGQVGGAANFDGAMQYIDTGADADLNITGNITFEAWVSTDQNGAIFDRYNSSGAFQGYGFDIGTGVSLKFSYWSSVNAAWVSGNTTVTDSTWRHIAVSVNGTTATFYMNGSTDGTPSSNVPGSFTTSVFSDIGIYNASNSPFHDRIDEIRISATNRSANWIATAYNNQFNPGTFYGVGAQGSMGGSGTAGIIFLQLYSQ